MLETPEATEAQQFTPISETRTHIYGPVYSVDEHADPSQGPTLRSDYADVMPSLNGGSVNQ